MCPLRGLEDFFSKLNGHPEYPRTFAWPTRSRLPFRNIFSGATGKSEPVWTAWRKKAASGGVDSAVPHACEQRAAGSRW